MELKNVPQDESATYGKMKKALYAKSEDGSIQSVSSSGWEAEETVTQQAIDDIDASKEAAYKEVKSGNKSPLYYYMFERRMDLALLSQATGFFQWTIKKDFKPSVFEVMNDKRLLVYCDALGKNIEEIKKLPKGENE